jgi:hypothetical protein
MANTLSKVGINTGNTVQDYHVTQSIDAFTATEAYDIDLSGSLDIEGPVRIVGELVVSGLTNTSQTDVVTIDPISGQFYYTSSNSLNITAITSSYALTASYVDLVAGPNITINQSGDTFEISSSAGFPSGNEYEVQFQTGSNELGGDSSFKFIYPSQSLQQGENVTVNSGFSHAQGKQTITAGDHSHAEGFLSVSSGSFSHAEGRGAISRGNYSHAEGYQSISTGDYSHAEGYQSISTGDYSHAEGRQTTSSGDYSHTEGISTTAVGDYSHAEGRSTTATGDYSHAEGRVTNSSGSHSHAEGNNTVSLGTYSHAEGQSTVSIGFASHAEGSQTTAGDDFAHAEGEGTQALGAASHAEGYYTQVSADYGHAEGSQTIVNGISGHAEGWYTTASNYSHAEGVGTRAGTGLTGIGSHAEGYFTLTLGLASHAEGLQTTASADYQHVSGKYNAPDSSTDTLFIVGNGTSTSNRRNAFKVKNNPGTGHGSIAIPTGSDFGSAVPAWTGEEGEMVVGFATSTGQYCVYAYVGGRWRSSSLS